MSKKKKVFKQKIRQILSEVEKGQLKAEKISEDKPPSGITSSQEVRDLLIISPNLVKQDLRKIAFIFGIILVLIAAAVIVSLRTNWLSILADKIYQWAQLGS